MAKDTSDAGAVDAVGTVVIPNNNKVNGRSTSMGSSSGGTLTPLTIDPLKLNQGSPFPSPSSSFLPPPRMGKHEFAIKPPPAARKDRSRTSSAASGVNAEPPAGNIQDALFSPTTPTPTGLAKTPTVAATPLASAVADKSAMATVPATHPAVTSLQNEGQVHSSQTITLTPPQSPLPTPQQTPTTPSWPLTGSSVASSSAASATLNSARNSLNMAYYSPDPSLTSSRPAPPSPAVSRKGSTNLKSGKRISTVSSSSGGGEGGSGSSRTPSRANSKSGRKSSTNSNIGGNANRLSTQSGFGFTMMTGSPMNLSFPSEQVQIPPPSPGHSRTSSRSRSVSSPGQNQTTIDSNPPSRSNSGLSPLPQTPQITPKHASASTNPSSRPEPPSRSTSYMSQNSAIFTASSHMSMSMKPKMPTLAPIKIRDFAFPSSVGEDPLDRHHGNGPDVPKACKPSTLNRYWRRLNKRGSTASSIVSSDGGEEEAEDDDDDDDGWGGFKWGMGRFSWSFGKAANAATSAAEQSQPQANGIGFPSKQDLHNAFTEGSEDSTEEYYDANDIDYTQDGYPGYGEDEEDDYYDDPSLDTPLPPGLYRAMYAFEPEGLAEMRLVEDQLVRVVGRHGCLPGQQGQQEDVQVGWVVVVRDEEDDKEDGELKDKALGSIEAGVNGAGKPIRHALVPESYLEPYQLDDELDEEAEGGVKAEDT